MSCRAYDPGRLPGWDSGRDTATMPTPQKPGETPNRTGPHHETGPRGGQVRNPRVVRITPDDGHMPPTQKPNRTWTPGKKHR